MISQTIFVRGGSALAASDELKAACVKALEANSRLDIDLSGTESMDLSGVQVLLAAAEAARSSGLAFELVSPTPEIVRAALARTGLDPSMFALTR